MKEYKVKVLSQGLAIGKAYLFLENKNMHLDSKDVTKEIDALNEVFAKTISELEEIYKNNKQESFILAHILLLQDKFLLKEIVEQIKKQNISAKSALSLVFDKYVINQKQASTEYLRQRYLDFLDLKYRLLSKFNSTQLNKETNDLIFCIPELLPSFLVENISKIKGVVSKVGSSISHGAILCASKGIPYVLLDKCDFKNQDTIIIDGYSQKIIKNPTKEQCDYYMNIINSQKNEIDFSKVSRQLKVSTNISDISEVDNMKGYNPYGIGLFRTEFIFIQNSTKNLQSNQEKIYKEACSKVLPNTVVFRTFDVGDDKKIPNLVTSKKGMDNYINYPKLFEKQVISILKANAMYGNASIMFPMIENSYEYRFLKNWVMMLNNKIEGHKDIKIGMMLETSRAINNIETFVNPDFMSVGTNDLLKDLYNISRNQQDSLSEDVIIDLFSKLKNVVLHCKKNNIKLSMCGELASKSKYIPMLLDIGFSSISASIGNFKIIYDTLLDYKKEN